jgi:hypothetical protein
MVFGPRGEETGKTNEISGSVQIHLFETLRSNDQLTTGAVIPGQPWQAKHKHQAEFRSFTI